MIKANDLRVGNFVIDEDGDPLTITCIEENYVWHDSNLFSNIDTIRGIKLTPHTLYQVGFKLDDSLSTIIRFRKSNFCIDLQKKRWYLHGYRNYPRGMEFIHELQNLYFALTGEELTVEINNVQPNNGTQCGVGKNNI